MIFAGAGRYRLDDFALMRAAVFATGVGLSACIMLISGDDLVLKVAGIVLLSVFSAASVGMEISHPLVWFNLGFLMYAISGPLLFVLDFHPYPEWSHWKIKEHLNFNLATDLHYIALLVAFCVLGPIQVNMARVKTFNATSYAEGCIPLLILAVLLAGLSIIELLGGQFHGKAEMVRDSDLNNFSFGYNVAVVALSALMYRVVQKGDVKSIIIVVSVTLAACLVVIALAGHRNVLFRSLLMFLFVYHTAYRRLSLKTLFVIATVALASVGFLGGLKMAFFADKEMDMSLVLGYRALQHNPVSIAGSDALLFLKLFLSVSIGNEFMTASNNLALLTTIVPNLLPFSGWEGFLVDFGRALLPGVAFQGVVQNSTLVYSATAFPELTLEGGGVGFTLVGGGYLYGGLPGVVLLFVFIGLMLKFLYLKSVQGPFWYFTYINSIAILIYAARTDISGPLSQIPKHVMLPLALMLLLADIMRRRKAFRRSSRGVAPGQGVPSGRPADLDDRMLVP